MNQNCPCKKKHCERHGNCESCRAHHAASKRQRPVACERKHKSVFRRKADEHACGPNE